MFTIYIHVWLGLYWSSGWDCSRITWLGPQSGNDYTGDPVGTVLELPGWGRKVEMRRDKLASRNALGMQPVDMYFGTELGQRCWGDGSQTMREELCKGWSYCSSCFSL